MVLTRCADGPARYACLHRPLLSARLLAKRRSPCSHPATEAGSFSLKPLSESVGGLSMKPLESSAV